MSNLDPAVRLVMNLAQQESSALNCLLSVHLELPHVAARAEFHGNPQTPALPVELPSPVDSDRLERPPPGLQPGAPPSELGVLAPRVFAPSSQTVPDHPRGVPRRRGRRLRARRSVAVLAPPLVSVAWLDGGRGGSSRVPVSNRVPLAYRASALPDAPTRHVTPGNCPARRCQRFATIVLFGSGEGFT